MFCGKCGAEIQEGAVFCSKCGNKNEPGVINKETSNNRVKLSKKKIGILISGMVIVALVVAIVIITGRRDGNKKLTNEMGTQQTVEQNGSSGKGDNSQVEETLYCPNFMGQSIDSINQNADYYNYFRFETIWEYNDVYEYAYVYEQSVNEGTAIEEGTQITLYVSKGEDVRYKEVAEQYATAIVKSDYNNINEYLPYNADSMIEYADFDSYEHGLDVTATVVNTEVASEEQIVEILDDISHEWNLYGFRIEDYIDRNKVNKGYLVDVRISVYEPEDNERWGSETFTYAVINYDGTWKVLTDFITDRDEMYEAW